MARRLHWPGVVLVAVLAGCAAVNAPGSAVPSGSGSPALPPFDSELPAPSDATPLPILDPLATPFPSLPPGSLDLAADGWQTVVAEFDPPTQELIGHWLAVGTLGSPEPAWFNKFAEAPWRFDLFATQQPVVDGPVRGEVLYVSDDGSSSVLRLVGVDGSGPRVVGVVEEVVYTARLSPDGTGAYLVLLDRNTGRDQGLWRVALTGDRTITEVMPAPAVDLAALGGGIRLAATTRFVRTVRVSADGSLVARMACGEPFGQCVLDVLDSASGRIVAYTPAEQSGDLTAIGDGAILGGGYCLDASRCVIEGVRLPGGNAHVFAGTPPAIDDGGHLVLLQFPSSTVAARRFYATNLDGSDRRLVFVTDGFVRLIHQEGVDFEGVRIELPWGWVLVSLDWPTDDGGFRTVPAAVRLADGGWVAVNLPQIYPIGGGHD